MIVRQVRDIITTSMSDTKLLKLSGDVSGDWIVESELPDGRLLIRPAGYPAVLTPGTGRALSPEELEAFWAEHAPHMLAPDDEG